MKKVYWLILLLLSANCCFSQKNLALRSHYSGISGITYAGVWHYDDTLGNEYALLGTSVGLTIVDITDPTNPIHLFDMPDTPCLWREVKVWSHYAYVSNEGRPGSGGGGISIINLSNLPDTPVYKKWTGDSSIAGLSTAHTVQAFNGYLYINGSRNSEGNFIYNGSTLMCSLSPDPWNPVFVGAADTLNYVHDCFVRGDTLITSEIYADPSAFSIFNISNMKAPVLLATQQTPSQLSHSSSMSDNGHYLFTTNELPRAPEASFDISNLQDIQLADLYWTTKNRIGEVHNPRVLNDFLINSCYGDSVHTGSQVTLVDASRPANLIEVGNYQLCPPAPGMMICWDADPFLNSGNIVASEGNHGLFVLAPTYIRACHFEGNVTDSMTNFPLNNVKIEILQPPADTLVLAVDSSLFTGAYKTGIADSGSYDVRFSPSPTLADSGYVARTITGVTCDNNLNVKLHKGVNGIAENMVNPNLFHVYPNPIYNNTTVSIDQSLLNNSHRLRLLITDALGKTVREITDINQEVTILSRNGIADGSYSIQLIDDSKKIAETTIVFE